MDIAFEVVNYEIMMFLGVPLFQSKVKTKTEDKFLPVILQNMRAETRVLHIRVLTEVFLSGGKSDDIKINHLLPEWHKRNAAVLQELDEAYKTPLPETGESPKTHIDKLLAHATTKRGSSFNWSPVVDRMMPPLLKVLVLLPIDKFPHLTLLTA